MEIKIRASRAEDAGELATIDSLCTQGEAIAYHYKRHDYFARSKLYKKWTVLVAEAGNVIVGMVAACVKTIKITQKFVSTGYIYDLKVHPRWRRKGISYLLLRQIETYLRTEKIRYVYSFLFGENSAIKKLSNSMDMYYCGDIKTLFFQCMPHPGPHVQLVDYQDMKKISGEIERYFKNYDLREKKPISVYYRKPAIGSPFSGIFSLKESLHTTAGVWDDSIHSTRILDRRPVTLRFFDKMSDKVKNKFNIPPFPGTGKKVVIRHLFDIRQKTYDPGKLIDFLHGMQTLMYKRGVHLLVVHMDTRDPLYKPLKQNAFTTMNGRIFMRTAITGELPPLLHNLYIDVRDM